MRIGRLRHLSIGLVLSLGVLSICSCGGSGASANAGGGDAETLDGLDSSDFALAIHSHASSYSLPGHSHTTQKTIVLMPQQFHWISGETPNYAWSPSGAAMRTFLILPEDHVPGTDVCFEIALTKDSDPNHSGGVTLFAACRSYSYDTVIYPNIDGSALSESERVPVQMTIPAGVSGHILKRFSWNFPVTNDAALLDLYVGRASITGFNNGYDYPVHFGVAGAKVSYQTVVE